MLGEIVKKSIKMGLSEFIEADLAPKKRLVCLEIEIGLFAQ